MPIIELEGKTVDTSKITTLEKKSEMYGIFDVGFRTYVVINGHPIRFNYPEEALKKIKLAMEG